MSVVNTVLKGHDLFRALPVKEVDAMTRFSASKHFEEGESIYRYKGAATHVFMLMEGAVTLQLPAEPRQLRIVISRIETGELFGLSALMGWERYTGEAKCVQPTDVLAIEGLPLRQLLQRNADVGFDTMSQVAKLYFDRYMNVLTSMQGVVERIPLIM